MKSMSLAFEFIHQYTRLNSVAETLPTSEKIVIYKYVSNKLLMLLI